MQARSAFAVLILVVILVLLVATEQLRTSQLVVKKNALHLFYSSSCAQYYEETHLCSLLAHVYLFSSVQPRVKYKSCKRQI